MGQNFSSEPVVAKETERDHNDTFNVAVSSCQGWRMTQEDNHSLMLELPGDHKAAFFAVYDGHGSARVSKHASEGLWRHLVQNEMYIKGNFKEALNEAFLTFDREVDESYNAQLAGTTAVCLLIVDNMIHCANIGDSRGVACVNCECVPLSYDHKPENPQELKRILAAGGYVLGNRVNGNLALSRAFGDFHYKGNEQLPPEQQIVSPFPDVTSIELKDDVDFLLLACDGIWDVLSSEEVVEFVISRLEQNMEPGLICEQLTTRCLATDYELVIGCDNMTVLLVCYTRGRSWLDFCADIFNKNTKRLGVPRIRPTTEESALEPQEQNQELEIKKVDTVNEDTINVLRSELESGLRAETSIKEEHVASTKQQEAISEERTSAKEEQNATDEEISKKEREAESNPSTETKEAKITVVAQENEVDTQIAKEERETYIDGQETVEEAEKVTVEEQRVNSNEQETPTTCVEHTWWTPSGSVDVATESKDSCSVSAPPPTTEENEAKQENNVQNDDAHVCLELES